MTDVTRKRAFACVPPQPAPPFTNLAAWCGLLYQFTKGRGGSQRSTGAPSRTWQASLPPCREKNMSDPANVRKVVVAA